VCAVVEENSHCVVRQLVAEAVLVGVVHPLRHPLQVTAPRALWNISGCTGNDRGQGTLAYSSDASSVREEIKACP